MLLLTKLQNMDGRELDYVLVIQRNRQGSRIPLEKLLKGPKEFRDIRSNVKTTRLICTKYADFVDSTIRSPIYAPCCTRKRAVPPGNFDVIAAADRGPLVILFMHHPTGRGAIRRRYSRTFPRPSAGILIKTSGPRRRRSRVSTGHAYEA